MAMRGFCEFCGRPDRELQKGTPRSKVKYICAGFDFEKNMCPDVDAGNPADDPEYDPEDHQGDPEDHPDDPEDDPNAVTVAANIVPGLINVIFKPGEKIEFEAVLKKLMERAVLTRTNLYAVDVEFGGVGTSSSSARRTRTSRSSASRSRSSRRSA